MKEEKSQLMPQNYKKTIREFYEQLYNKQILQPGRNGQLLRNIQPTKMKSIKRNQPSSKLRKHQLEILTNREAHCGV